MCARSHKVLVADLDEDEAHWWKQAEAQCGSLQAAESCWNSDPVMRVEPGSAAGSRFLTLRSGPLQLRLIPRSSVISVISDRSSSSNSSRLMSWVSLVQRRRKRLKVSEKRERERKIEGKSTYKSLHDRVLTESNVTETFFLPSFSGLQSLWFKDKTDCFFHSFLVDFISWWLISDVHCFFVFLGRGTKSHDEKFKKEQIIVRQKEKKMPLNVSLDFKLTPDEWFKNCTWV